MYKRTLACLALVAGLLCWLSLPVRAVTAENGTCSLTKEPTLTAPPSVSAQAAILIDGTFGITLWAQNADVRLPMASTTKIMTALTALRHASADERISVSPDAVGVEGSSIYLTAGEELSLGDLLYALLLQSANDAAAAIAVHIGGSIAGFAELMNAEAERLGLQDTHFVNPHGLDDPEHYTTARELAIVTQTALQVPLIRQIVGTVKKTIPLNGQADARLLVNHNRLLRTYDSAIGVKTGYTKKCGRCLVSAAERNGIYLIAVTLNAPDDWRDHAAMLDYGFAQYSSQTLCRTGDGAGALPVTGGVTEHIDLRYADTLNIALPQGHAPISVTVEAPHFLYAPLLPDQAVGTAVFSCDLNGDGVQECIGRIPLITAGAVEQKTPQKRSLWQRLCAWLTGK